MRPQRTEIKNPVIFDIETFRNYFLVAFKSVRNQHVVKIEMRGQDATLDAKAKRRIITILSGNCIVGFNSMNFDTPILMAALSGFTCLKLKELANHIINNNYRGWMAFRDLGMKWPEHFEHIDIQEPTPGIRVSLKLYGARINSGFIQDLPYEHDAYLEPDQMNKVANYCENDLQITMELFKKIKPRIILRFDMESEYGIPNLTSKSDAQIAEAIIKEELRRKIYNRRGIRVKESYRYTAPDFISFDSPELNEILDYIEGLDIGLTENGGLNFTAKMKKAVQIGDTIYKFGIGGLHSMEKSKTYHSTETMQVIDRDVEAYYPNIILNLGLTPEHIGEAFLDVYKDLVDKRIKAKREGDTVVNESMKIVINGSFGKFGSKYSAIYSPDLLMNVTFTGQLSLLMLIEKLEANGIQVVSANTDGFVSLVNEDKRELYNQICEAWEEHTKFKLEETLYDGICIRDVNNYFAFRNGKKVKGKGVFAVDQLQKNPHVRICSEAVENHVIHGWSIRDQIIDCKDITKFMLVRTVNGGATYNGDFVGKVMRWVYVQGGYPILYKKNGHKVPKSDNSLPVMRLTKIIPSDLDYLRYIEEATSLLGDVGQL